MFVTSALPGGKHPKVLSRNLAPFVSEVILNVLPILIRRVVQKLKVKFFNSSKKYVWHRQAVRD